MATHTQLPIYKVAYDLLDVATDLVKNMPRDFKQSIGGKINSECVEIVVLIFRANCAQDKAPHLLELVERLQVAELLIRLAKDKRLISQGAYAKAVELSTSIGKQANGWRRAASLLRYRVQVDHEGIRANRAAELCLDPINDAIDFTHRHILWQMQVQRFVIANLETGLQPVNNFGIQRTTGLGSRLFKPPAQIFLHAQAKRCDMGSRLSCLIHR